MTLNSQNVLFITRANIHAGTENVILQLCEVLKPHVNKIIVCSADGFKTNNLLDMGIKFYKIPDIEKKDPGTIIKVCFTINKIVKEEKITIIHAHHRMAAFYVSILKLYNKCVFFVTAHNTFYNKKALTRFAYRNSIVVACGEMVKKNLVEVFGLPDEQVRVIHNAVKPFDGNVIIDPLIKKFHDEGDFVIGNIGRLSEQKGMEYFIKAIPEIVNKHPNTRFVIAGSGEDEQRLRALSTELNVEKYLTFLGYRTDIQNLMSQLDLIVLSSLWEGLPLTPIEAFSVGKTIIATAVDGTPEIVKDMENGLLVDARNSKQLEERIIWILNNSHKKQLMEDAAIQTFFEKFSFMTFSKKYIDIYEEVIYGKGIICS